MRSVSCATVDISNANVLLHCSIHELNLVGHVEDVCVAKTFQGRHLGKTLLDALNAIGKAVGVGKMSLNCSPQNIEFYRKCGYETAGQQMHILHKHNAS